MRCRCAASTPRGDVPRGPAKHGRSDWVASTAAAHGFRCNGVTATPGSPKLRPSSSTSPICTSCPRRRLAANFAALALVLLGILMLSAVVLHTRLAERQRQIDQLEQQVDVQHDLFDVLRQQRAVLRSPTRLATESTRLGMFAPPESNFVAVDPWALAQIVAATGSTESLDGLLVDDDALDQVRRVREAETS